MSGSISLGGASTAAQTGGLGARKASLPPAASKTVGGAVANGIDEFLGILKNLATDKAGHVAVNFAELAVPAIDKAMLKPLVAAPKLLAASSAIRGGSAIAKAASEGPSWIVKLIRGLIPGL